jgi:hypothetical protein
MSEGFLSRWAKRKEAVRRGEEVAPEATREPAPAPSSPPSPHRGEGEEPPRIPTLEDTHDLTPASDFTRFVRPEVPSEVKNAALKKLFADPHFNTMDGLDVYIDDYNKPDPLPPEMLRQLASAKWLAGPAADDSMAQSSQPPGAASSPAADHADPDLRLQQDDAPGPEGPGPGTQ